MKLFLALLLLGGLTAAAVLVPVSGETAWQHAERKGWPLAAAHAFVRTANAGAHWVAVTLQGHPTAPPPSRGPRRRLARLPSPAGTAAGSGPGRGGSPSATSGAGHLSPAAPWAPLPASSRAAPFAAVARAAPGAPASTVARAAPASPATTLARPASGEAPSAGPRDRIVAATPAEQLEGPDRAALDKLITARGGR